MAVSASNVKSMDEITANNEQVTNLTGSKCEKRSASPPASKVRVRRGLARRLPTADLTNPKVPTVGVYTSAVSTFHERLKKNLDLAALDQLTHTCKSDPDSQESEDCRKASNPPVQIQVQEALIRSPSPPLPPVVVISGQSRRLNTKNHKLLKEIEETQLLYLSQKAIEKSKRADELDLTSDFESTSSQECICEEAEQEMEKLRSIAVKVMSHNQITKFTMLKKDNFSKLISELAKKSEIEETQVLLTLNELVIKSYDTPLSIRLNVADIIEFGILSKEAEAIEPTGQQNPNLILLKVQTKTTKNKVDITINKNDPMSRLMEEFAKRIGSDVSKLVLKFDGDEIEPGSTPEELELEDGYCIDVVLTG